MMKLNIISGFLGSGKTTLIIKLARKIVERGLKVSILVNEIGDIGIDDQYMKKVGLNVWEILGGCICCSLSSSIASTLEKLKTDYQPDIVFLEPSGAADLRSVEQNLANYQKKNPIAQTKITVVDPLRIEMAMEIMSPLITSQIKSAECAVISKLDEATDSEIAYARLTIEEINPTASIYLVTNESIPDKEFLGMLL